jgi:hypothetical protein
MSRVTKPDFPKPLGMITEFSTKPSKIHVLLGNIHHQLAVVFTSLYPILRVQTFSCLH